MKTYEIKITEILQRVVTVKAENDELAISKAEDLYADGSVVLDSSHHKETIFTLEEY